MVGHLITPSVSLAAKFYRKHKDAILPERKSIEAAGLDLHTIEDFSLAPGERVVVGTGLVIQPPPGYHTEILIRSSMSYKHNIMLINGVGLIDRDYSGVGDELKIMLYRAPRLSKITDGVIISPAIKFKKGARIAQLVFRQTVAMLVEEVFEAPGGTRGGFGSTGV